MNKKRLTIIATIGFVLIFLALMVWSSADAADFNLSWEAPTTNADGTPLRNLPLKYKIYYGTTSRAYETPIEAGSVLLYKVIGLLPNKVYFFAVQAVNALGTEGQYSNEVIKMVLSVTGAPILNQILTLSI